MAEPIRPISQAAVNDTSGTTVGTPEQQQDAQQVSSQANDVPYESDGLETVVIRDREDNFTSISSFLARNRVTGFSKSNRFLVDFYLGNLFSDLQQRDFANILTYKCEQAEFPGREFVTSDARIYGPMYKVPYMSSYGDVSLTLLCDNNLIQKQLFEVWMSVINTPFSFDFKYRDSYVCDVQITQFNELNQSTYVCTLHEAYPVAVAPLQTNWGDDAFNRLQVTLTYRYWTAEILTTNDEQEYTELQQEHIRNVQEARFDIVKPSFFDVENRDHQRKIARANEESRNNFRAIVDQLLIDNEDI